MDGTPLPKHHPESPKEGDRPTYLSSSHPAMIDGQLSPIYTGCCGEKQYSIADVTWLTTASYAAQVWTQSGCSFAHFTDTAVLQDVSVSPAGEDAVTSNAIAAIHPCGVSTDS